MLICSEFDLLLIPWLGSGKMISWVSIMKLYYKKKDVNALFHCGVIFTVALTCLATCYFATLVSGIGVHKHLVTM